MTVRDARLRDARRSAGAGDAWPRGCSASSGCCRSLYAFWTAFHPAEFSTRFVLTAPLTLENFEQGVGGGAVRALLPQHGDPRHDGARGAARAGDARRVRVRALRVPGPQRAVRAGARAADGHARRADRRELPDDDGARPQGHDPRDRRCRTWRARSASSCCARRSRPSRASSTRRRASKAARRCRCCGRSTCRSRGPTYLAYALVSVSYHWNNFLWPLIITNSVESRPVTVGLQVFSATDQGIDWSIITAATLLTHGAAAGRVPAVPAAVRADRSCARASR